MTWSVDSETGVLTDVLLCRPDYYHWIDTNAVAHTTLNSTATFNKERAIQQYDGLLETLDRTGVRTHFLVPSPAHPYQVYTRDSSQTTPWGPVLTQLALPERRGEYASLMEFHAQYGGFFRYASKGTCEGGDIHIVRPGLLIIGHSGVRSNAEGAMEFAEPFQAAGWEVRLQPFPEHFLHLDVVFCMATDTLAVVCVDVLGEDFANFLTARGIDIITASYAEVMAMSCNLLSLGDARVISPAHSVRINAELRARGVRVFDPELDVFANGGGSIHCMTMPLRREALP